MHSKNSQNLCQFYDVTNVTTQPVLPFTTLRVNSLSLSCLGQLCTTSHHRLQINSAKFLEIREIHTNSESSRGMFQRMIFHCWIVAKESHSFSGAGGSSIAKVFKSLRVRGVGSWVRERGEAACSSCYLRRLSATLNSLISPGIIAASMRNCSFCNIRHTIQSLDSIQDVCQLHFFCRNSAVFQDSSFAVLMRQCARCAIIRHRAPSTDRCHEILLWV